MAGAGKGRGTPATATIVGGGFGGYYAAHELHRRGIAVTLVDESGSQTFQPLLYQAATGLIRPSDIEFPLAELDGVEVVAQRAAAADLPSRTVTLADGTTLAADHLLLATGAAVNFFGVSGAAQHAFPLYTGADAARIKAQLERLVTAGDPFSIVVVGAGDTGVEVTGALLAQPGRARAQDVLGEDARCFFRVAGEGGIDDGLVFRMDVPRDGIAEQGQPPVTLGLVIQDGLEMADPAGRAGRDQHLVERPVAQFPFLAGGLGTVGELLLGAGQQMEGGHHAGLPGVVPVLDGLLQGGGFQQHAGAGDVLEVVEGDRCDAETALPLGHHQRIGDQQLQCLPQGAGTHGILVFEVFDA